MPLIDEQTLKGQIKENKFQTSYLIYGSEAYLKQYYANLIASKCVSKDMEGFNLRKFDAENNNDIRELMEATDTLPVFSEYTCTLMKNFALDSMYSQDKAGFEEWLKNMPETTVAVFWQDTTEINPKKNAKWKSVIELFNKYGAVLCLDTMDRNSLAKTVAGGLKKRGKEIDRVTAFYLIDTVGDDLNILLNEVDKLANYCQGESVTKADIDAVCIKSLEANVFDLSKSLVGRNLSRCYHILNKLFEDKEKPEIVSISPAETEVLSTAYNKVSALVSDNVKLASVTMEYRLSENDTFKPFVELKDIKDYYTVAEGTLPEAALKAQTVEIRVNAVDGAGLKADTKTVKYTVDNSFTDIKEIKAEQLSDHIALTWKAEENKLSTGYYIYKKANTAAWQRIGSMEVDAEKKGEYLFTDYSINAANPGANPLITIKNTPTESPSVELPTTGSTGTRIYYTIGGILLLLSAAGYVTAKRRRWSDG